ncbi:hypothetical protein AB1K83_18045 [Sporosarcina sp. 179-K 3D1 HS]|uniref:hypothetical protein n=1 Tax=Sporosarcina sp. 179-K 3D1 HS TaxID=3232169 RepID=UPI0039A3A0E1
MKKAWVILVVALIGFGIYAVGYFSTYHIKGNEAAAEEFLIEFDKKKSGMGVSETIDWLQLGGSNSWLSRVLFQDGVYGYAHFVKGWNGKMKFISLGTTPHISYREFETDEGLYGVVFGRNDNRSIDHINVKTGGETPYEFVVEVKNQENFMVSEKLPDGIQGTLPAEFEVVDKEGNVMEAG